MRILHVTPLYHPASGGAERHVRIVSEGLAQRGHDVTVLTTNVANDHDLYHRKVGHLPEEETLDGVRVLRQSPATGHLVRALEAALRLPGAHRLLSRTITSDGLEMLRGFPRNLRAVAQILASPAEVVVVWNWYWPLCFHAYLARRVRRFPLVGIPLFHTEERWTHRPLYDRIIAACDGVLVNTEHEVEFIHGRVGRPTPVAVAGVGIDPARFERADGARFRRRHGLGEEPLVGFVGRMMPSKGPDRLVRAMPAVWNACGEARLVLAGHRGSAFTELDARLACLSEDQRGRVLELTDFAESEKADLMAALDVLVVPSTGESFGIVYLEAWACGTPVIGSDIGSTRCVIEPGVNGLLVDPDDSEDIAGKILEVILRPRRGAEMAHRGRAKTLRFHTWDRVMDRVEQFYQEISAGVAGRVAV